MSFLRCHKTEKGRTKEKIWYEGRTWTKVHLFSTLGVHTSTVIIEYWQRGKINKWQRKNWKLLNKNVPNLGLALVTGLCVTQRGKWLRSWGWYWCAWCMCVVEKTVAAGNSFSWPINQRSFRFLVWFLIINFELLRFLFVRIFHSW